MSSILKSPRTHNCVRLKKFFKLFLVFKNNININLWLYIYFFFFLKKINTTPNKTYKIDVNFLKLRFYFLNFFFLNKLLPYSISIVRITNFFFYKNCIYLHIKYAGIVFNAKVIFEKFKRLNWDLGYQNKQQVRHINSNNFIKDYVCTNILTQLFQKSFYNSELNHFEVFFLRKSRVFNKGRYSRNRQNYRTGVYLCFYLSILSIFWLYYTFYKFSFNFSYLWFFFFFF